MLKANTLLEKYNSNSMFVSKKIKNGVLTNETCFTFGCEEKIPINELPVEKIIPSKITYENKTLPTDVIQTGKIKSLGCGDTGASSSEEQLQHRTKIRPIIGGISIQNFWDSVSYVGTLGQLCIDQIDSTVSGLTNCHVATEEELFNHSKEKYYNLYKKEITQPALWEDEHEADNLVYYTSFYNGYQWKEVAMRDKIGFVKRYIPIHLLTEELANLVDAALISINSDVVNNSSTTTRSSCFGVYNVSNSLIPWATNEQIEQIENAFNQGNDIYVCKSGRTTGVTGADYESGSCPVIARSFEYITNVSGYGVSPNSFAQFQDCIMFEYENKETQNTSPIHGGDSGSVLITNYFGSPVVIGLCFAGGDEIGVACKINNVRSQLEIRDANSSDINSPLSFSDPSNWRYISIEGYIPDVTFEYNGKKYWQIGIIPKK